MFCFDRKFRLLPPCCFFETTLKFKTFRFGMRVMLWGAWSVLYDSNPSKPATTFFKSELLGCWFYSFYLLVPILYMYLFSWVNVFRTWHTMTHIIWYNIQTKINTNDTCTLLQHAIGTCLGIPRYAYIIRNYCNQRLFAYIFFLYHKALSCFHFFGCAQVASASFCDTHRVRPWNSLPSQAGFVVCFLPDTVMELRHFEVKRPCFRIAFEQEQIMSISRAPLEPCLKCTSRRVHGVLFFDNAKQLVKIAGNIGQLGFTSIK